MQLHLTCVKLLNLKITAMKDVLAVLSGLCYIFAIADVVLFYIFDVDLTGVEWSPIAASLVGVVLGYFAKESQ